MAIEVIVPRLGWSMDTGTLADWLKREGEFVRKGDMLFVLEGEKATEEIECLDEGYLRFLPEGPMPGDAVRVGQVIALLVSKEEAASEPPSPPKPESTASTKRQPAGSRQSRFDAAHVAGGPAARRQARVEARQADATPAQEQPRDNGRPARTVASPRARRKASELGIDLAALKGTGRSGRVRERDVLRAAERREPGSAPHAEVKPSQIWHTPIRRTIAERMVASRQSTAPVTLTSIVDATSLVALRDQFKAAGRDKRSTVPSYTDFIVKLTALALAEHPALNARWQDDAIVQFTEVHMGIAVDTDDGLLVPVVRDVQQLGLRAIAAQSRELEQRARERRLSADQMRGGTFTISNLGGYGIDAFTPIINPPQCAILGIGRIRKQPWVVDEKLVPRDILTLSLTFDHRVVDGAPAARFLQAVCAGIEQPAERLIR